jgi:colanic acid biosynthesis glycosyl transferase WcaI
MAQVMDNKSRLWVVTELYFPEETSTGYYLTCIAEGLADRFDVKVICGQPNYSSRGLLAPKHETRNSVEIFRVFGTTLDKNVIPFRLLNMLSLNISALFKGLLRFRSGDRILVVTTPPLMPFAASFAALCRGAAYTLLIHDNYPEILFAVGKAKENSLFSRVLNFFNRSLYKYAAKIIVVGRDMRELIATKTTGFDVPIAVISNWAELETVNPQPKSENKLLADLGLLDKFVFLYAGNMGHPNDLETIISCANKLKGEDRIHFIFLGSGVKESWLRKVAEEKDLTNVTILKPQPRSEQIVFLNACDVALVSLVNKMRGVSMPSRTYNILAAGKPILALTDSGSEIAQVIEEDQAGWAVPPNEPELLMAAIKEIYAKRNDLEVMSSNARNAAIDKYSLTTAIEKYRSELA